MSTLDASLNRVEDSRVGARELQAFGFELLHASGMVDAEASIVSEMLVETSMRGTDSHGVIRFPVYARRCRAGGIVSPAPIQWVRNARGVGVLDGGAGAGHVVAVAAVDDVVTRARAQGIAAVGVRNSNHLGALALHSGRIADQGQIGIVATNASPRIAPTGGSDALLGNNPWSIAVPHTSGPLVMDIAHSVVAVGKIRMHKAAGEPLPEGWARDRDGRPTTDPDEALSGLVDPIGGHKGYALVLMMDILCSVLTGAESGPGVSGLFALDKPGGVGHQFIAIDIEHFTSPTSFARRLESLLDLITSSARAPGVEAILLPGDPEKRAVAERRANGIPVPAATAADFFETATDLGVEIPQWLGSDEGPEQRTHV